MARGIVARTQQDPAHAADPVAAAAAPKPDDYLGRLLKYVPTELVALYLTLASSVPAGRIGWQWGIFIGCWIATPIYLYLAIQRSRQPIVRRQIVLASFAFPIWVYAIGGPFESLDWYEANRFVGSIAVAIATFAFPLCQSEATQ